MAADRQGEVYSAKTERTKIKRLPDGSLFGAAGEIRASEALYHWLVAGAVPVDFPKLNPDDKPTALWARHDGLFLIDWGTTHPTSLENKFFALGSGMDAAIAAMFLGHDARQAVEVACEVCTGCGGGIDELVL